MERSAGVWQLRLELRLEYAVDYVSVAAWSEEPYVASRNGEGERVSVANAKGATIDIDITGPTIVGAADGDSPHVVVSFVSPDRLVRDHVRVDLERVGDELAVIAPAEAERRRVLRSDDKTTELRLDGAVIPHAAWSGVPWEVEDLPREHRDELRAKFEAKLAGDLGMTEAPLEGVNRPTASTEAQTGCRAGATSASVLLVLLVGVVSMRRRRLLSVGLVLVGVAGPTVSGRAETRCIWGYTAFWDSRNIEAGDDDPYVETSYPGFRHQPCDDADETCAPWDDDCCFTEMHGVTLQLRRELNGVTQATVDTEVSSDASGSFVMCDTGWGPQYTYSVGFKYVHDASYPAWFEVRTATGSGPVISWIFIGGIPSGYHGVGIVSANEPGDTSSYATGLAKHWASAYETFTSLTQQGETRYKRNYGSANAYDRIIIRVDAGINGAYANCPDNVRVRPDDLSTPHELGHITHFRVIGCAEFEGFGPFDPHLYYHNTESVALVEGIANFVGMLWAFDDAVASTEHVVTQSAPCESVTHENDTVSEFNIANAMYDLVDVADDYSDGAYDDTSQIQAVEIFDAILELQLTNGDPGQNYTDSEWIVNDAATQCSPPSDPYGAPSIACAAGLSCGTDGTCYGGDQHGENLRDVIHYLSDETSGYTTMQSSTCVGVGDNSAPFNGGYRSQ